MRPVAVIGMGKTAFGTFPDRDLRSLGVEAGQKALADAHVEPGTVEAGLHDIVVVAGVEKRTSQSTPRVTEILAGAGDMSSEGKAGATFPALFAMIARRHMYQYGTTREQLAAVAVKNHANGAKNPLAHMRK